MDYTFFVDILAYVARNNERLLGRVTVLLIACRFRSLFEPVGQKASDCAVSRALNEADLDNSAS